MKLMTIANVSADGVMQGLGASDEDRRGGFERGGWALPLFDDEAETFSCTEQGYAGSLPLVANAAGHRECQCGVAEWNDCPAAPHP